MLKTCKVLISGFEPFLNIKVNPTEILVTGLSHKLNEKGLLSEAFLKDLNLDHVCQSLLSNVIWQTMVLPVDFKTSFEILNEQIQIFKPDLVLATGVAEGRLHPELERIAINHRSISASDNSGTQIQNTKLVGSGPDGLFCNFDVDQVAHKVNLKLLEQTFSKQNQNKSLLAKEQDTLELKVSNSAGTYVCNALMYQLLLQAQRMTKKEPTGLNASQYSADKDCSDMDKPHKFLTGFLHIPNRIDEGFILYVQKLILELCLNALRLKD